MIHIQNATLAGGIVICTSINAFYSPAESLIYGFLAGVITTVVMRFTEILSKRDTRYILSVHLIPAILGIVLMVAYAFIFDDK